MLPSYTTKYNGAEVSNLLKAGSSLDAAPVYTTTAFRYGLTLIFNDLLLRTKSKDLNADAFISLAPGDNIKCSLDAATDMEADGPFESVAESYCSATQQTTLTNALPRKVQLSNATANAATSGSATKLNKYFRAITTTVRNTVAARFRGRGGTGELNQQRLHQILL